MASSAEDGCGHGAPPTDRSAFRFLDLPGELRNMIYSLVLIHEQRLEPHRLLSKTDSEYKKPINFPILQVCKQIEREATPLFFSINTFSTRMVMKTRPYYRMDVCYVDDWFLSKKYTFPIKHINIKTYSELRWISVDLGSAVRIIHMARRNGLKVTVEDRSPPLLYWRSFDYPAIILNLADHYPRLSTHGRSFKTIRLNDGPDQGLILYDKPVENHLQTPSGASYAAFTVDNSGKNLVFTTPSRFIYELPLNVQLKIADYATESEQPVEINLNRDDWAGTWRKVCQNGPLMVNRSLREGSSPYYFNKTRFKVHVEIEACDPWHRQFRPIKNWVDTYLPGKRKGTPLALRHLTLVLDFSRSKIRSEDVRLQLIHFVRLLLHVDQDAVDVIVKTAHSSTSISLQALRRKALTALTQMFGLDYLNHDSVSWLCPAIWMDGNGHITSTSLKPTHKITVPDKDFYAPEKQKELLCLYHWQHNKYVQPQTPNGLSSVGTCMSCLRQVLEKPKRVKELIAIYEFAPSPSFYRVCEFNLQSESKTRLPF